MGNLYRYTISIVRYTISKVVYVIHLPNKKARCISTVGFYHLVISLLLKNQFT